MITALATVGWLVLFVGSIALMAGGTSAIESGVTGWGIFGALMADLIGFVGTAGLLIWLFAYVVV